MSLVWGVLAALYVLGAGLLFVFVGGFAILLMIYLLKRGAAPPLPDVSDDELPSVTVQLPVYNEPHVVDRLLDACAKLDYPAEKLHIQVLDDSTDRTSEFISRKIHSIKRNKVCNIQHIRRHNREGYKAGALTHALKYTTTECIVVFDADFLPPPDFLRRTMPHFSVNPQLGLVQTRWGHLNDAYNPLTRAQALSIDAHFVIEQVARSRGKLPMSMNGTGGIWRVTAIEDAGGWSSQTLTEDLDLSYRAFMRGWEFIYRVDVVVPGELPPLVHIYKTQQARWATGSTQCLIRHGRELAHSADFSPLQKLMGLLHLAQYAIQPVILMLFLLTPLLLAGGAYHDLPDFGLLALLGIVPILITSFAQIEVYADWRHRLLYFPAHFMTGVAIVLNNSYAVLNALWNWNEAVEFKRTPKFRLMNRGDDHRRYTGASRQDAGRIDLITWGELILVGYAMAGFVVAIQTLPAAAPYMLVYALSFMGFAAWNIYQIRQVTQLTPRRSTTEYQSNVKHIGDSIDT